MLCNSGPVTRKGYFLVERDFMNLQIFKKQPYTEREAWIYLIENAAFKVTLREVDGMAITLQRGQLVGAYRYLAEAWQWLTPKGNLSKDKVRRFIDKLDRHGWVSVSTNYYVERDSNATVFSKPYNKRPALITVLHYNELQRKEGERPDKKTDSDTQENATALIHESDKPNQIQSTSNNEINNQSVGSVDQDVFLFEEFPQVENSEDFIKYMPTHWQNYALQEKGWEIDTVIEEAQAFWERYAGRDMSDRLKKHSSFEKRKYWKRVWFSWCDQEFRNAYN
jgi:hypothetical protein